MTRRAARTNARTKETTSRRKKKKNQIFVPEKNVVGASVYRSVVKDTTQHISHAAALTCDCTNTTALCTSPDIVATPPTTAHTPVRNSERLFLVSL